MKRCFRALVRFAALVAAGGVGAGWTFAMLTMLDYSPWLALTGLAATFAVLWEMADEERNEGT